MGTTVLIESMLIANKLLRHVSASSLFAEFQSDPQRTRDPGGWQTGATRLCPALLSALCASGFFKENGLTEVPRNTLLSFFGVFVNGHAVSRTRFVLGARRAWGDFFFLRGATLVGCI